MLSLPASWKKNSHSDVRGTDRRGKENQMLTQNFRIDLPSFKVLSLKQGRIWFENIEFEGISPYYLSNPIFTLNFNYETHFKQCTRFTFTFPSRHLYTHSHLFHVFTVEYALRLRENSIQGTDCIKEIFREPNFI